MPVANYERATSMKKCHGEKTLGAGAVAVKKLLLGGLKPVFFFPRGTFLCPWQTSLHNLPRAFFGGARALFSNLPRAILSNFVLARAF